MLQTNLDTLLFCRNLLCRKLLQVSEYGPRLGNDDVYFSEHGFSRNEELFQRHLFTFTIFFDLG
jgi:hypothetical protein